MRQETEGPKGINPKGSRFKNVFSRIYMFVFGFIACLIVTHVYYYGTSSRYKTLRPLTLKSSRNGSTILIPSGTELLHTERFDDFIFSDEAYYLMVGVDWHDVVRARNLGEHEGWMQRKELN